MRGELYEKQKEGFIVHSTIYIVNPKYWSSHAYYGRLSPAKWAIIWLLCLYHL